MAQKLPTKTMNQIGSIAEQGIKLLEWDVKDEEKTFQKALKSFFSSKTADWEPTVRELESSLGRMEALIEKEKANVKGIAHHIPKGSILNISGNLGRIQQRVEGWRGEKELFEEEWTKRLHTMHESIVFKDTEYGQGKERFFDGMRKLKKTDADTEVAKLEHALEKSDTSDLIFYSKDYLLKLVWFYAMEKPYSVSAFQRVTDVYERFHAYTTMNTDLQIAKLYAKHQIGGEDALRKDVDAIFDLHAKETGTVWQQKAPAYFGALASALMWMQCYSLEKTVLQYMLNRGLEMPLQLQNRLHMLAKGGGKTMTVQSAATPVGDLCFDVSALNWRQEQYENLFEQLAFQDRTLPYALAVRDEDKDAMLMPGTKKPSTLAVAKRLKAVMDDEYGDEVQVKSAAATAMSGGNQEELDGILITTEECPQMGVYMYLFGIGKKLKIKFYTLYMPGRETVAAQKQKALSLYNGLSPQVSMWESSLKESALAGIQQLLNAAAGGSKQGGSASITRADEGPIF